MPRFTPDFLDELKARLKPSEVIGRYVKLRKQGNEWAGLSPFTKEKTPSFFVNDQKRFYHCFSSGKHGDIITFLTETQGLSFHEAVARLAEEAGMQLPADDPREEEQARKRKGLAEACEAAEVFFSKQLHRAQGREALAYLHGRGVSDKQIDAFNIGYAPDSRTALKDYLINKGYAEETLVEAGLLIKPEDGGPTYDRFRNRVMFPILGVTEQVIAFGGRALDKEARAKYLNSPETPLFHKGNVLYNFAGARKASPDAGPLIVCEGYMDVIALWGAGFTRAVAPLGTALTENQLALLWRSADEPVMCLDGDKAGVAAAYRAIDRAMPMLKPGKSLSFVFLPDGQDPDDLVRSAGAGAFRSALGAAEPLVDVLWRRETEARPLDTPERRAALRAHLREMVKTVADKDVRKAYGDELARRLEETFSPPPRASAQRPPLGAAARRGGPGRGGSRFPGPTPEARATSALKRHGAPSSFAREATLVLAAINHPYLVERHESAFLNLHLENRDLAGLLGEVLSAILTDPALDSAGLKRHLQSTKAADILERVLKDDTLKRQRFLLPLAEIDEVEWGWSDALRHHLFATNAQAEVAASASQTFISGEDGWKAAVTAREELVNAGEPPLSVADDGDVPPAKVTSALEDMRRSVEEKRKRRH
ncbi:MAG: DNA primase [Pseudomonadota bacterium]|nr:DNA primase [Pseudomonadota bacterium]